jgi:hypothetical protein
VINRDGSPARRPMDGAGVAAQTHQARLQGATYSGAG